jgi:hypothetical protein
MPGADQLMCFGWCVQLRCAHHPASPWAAVPVVLERLQRPPPAVGRGEAAPPHKMFLVRFGGEAAKTNQKLGFGAQPQRRCTSPARCTRAVATSASGGGVRGAAPETLHQPCPLYGQTIPEHQAYATIGGSNQMATAQAGEQLWR